jgi:hypothetical protein
MDVSLTPEQAEFVRKLEVLRKEIAIGIEQADRGGLVNGDEIFDRIRERLRSRPDAKGFSPVPAQSLQGFVPRSRRIDRNAFDSRSR